MIPGWIGFCLIAALAWTITVESTGTMGISFVAFLPVWVVMMIAMMFPSVAPMALLWVRSVSSRSRTRDRVAGIALFLAGYLCAWTAFGALVYIMLVGTGKLANNYPGVARWVGVAIFAVAGIYQFTPWKGACLRHCRTPFGSLFHYASYKGLARDLRVGAHHGLYCVGCCWGLMIILVAVGAMNIPVMIVLAGAIFIEKIWRHGEAVSRLVGLSLLVVAALVPFAPSLIPGLTVNPMTGM